MQLEKRGDGLSLRNLAACLRAQDAAGAGVLDFDGFVLGLKKYKYVQYNIIQKTVCSYQFHELIFCIIVFSLLLLKSKH